MRSVLYFCLCASLYLTYPMQSVEAATYEYDELGRVTQVTNEDGSCVTYIYDANGNIVEIKTETASDEATWENGTNVQSATDSALQDDAKDTAGDHTSVISGYTVSDNQADESVEEDQESDNKAFDLIEEEMAKQEETETEDRKNKFLLALLITGVTGGIIVFLWKKLKKSKGENEEESGNE